MAAPAPVTADARAIPRWGLGDAAAGWILAYSMALVTGLLLVPVFGYETADLEQKRYSIVYQLLQVPPLWIGFVGLPIWAAAVKGRGWVIDFRARVKPIDALVGIPAGFLAQLILVPLISRPVLWLTKYDADDLARPAQELADKAHGFGPVLLLVLVVAIGAPLAEELFFRGLVLRAVEKRWTTRIAIVASSLVFGATHLQPLQFPALVAAGAVFAVLAVKFDRLGPAVFAHIAFNSTTVVALLLMR